MTSFAVGMVAAALALLQVAPIAQAQLVRDLLAAAIERTAHSVRYDGSYRAMSYPGGDVPPDVGACTDLIVRAYRGVGVDLQELVHEDMLVQFEVTGHYRYPGD